MSRRIFITGNSSGLGRGLTEAFLEAGDRVYGVSRRGCAGPTGDLHDIRCDIGDGEALTVALEELLKDVPGLDLVILNAGTLGRMQDLHETGMDEIREIMEVNVWANKRIMDWLIASRLEVDQVVFISSGASRKGGSGWGAYSISKAALNMLASLYACEFPDTHISALAPGIVDTPMQEYLCTEADAERFPSLKALRDARGSGAMPSARDAGRRIAAAIPKLKLHPSGGYVDIRSLDD